MLSSGELPPPPRIGAREDELGSTPDESRNFRPGVGWQWHRDRLRRLLDQRPIGGISGEEFAAHFEGMPPRYWDRVTEDELVWGIQTVHRFFGKLATTDSAESCAV